MHNLSISDLNCIQFDEKFTGQLLVHVENGRISLQSSQALSLRVRLFVWCHD